MPSGEFFNKVLGCLNNTQFSGSGGVINLTNPGGTVAIADAIQSTDVPSYPAGVETVAVTSNMIAVPSGSHRVIVIGNIGLTSPPGTTEMKYILRDELNALIGEVDFSVLAGAICPQTVIAVQAVTGPINKQYSLSINNDGSAGSGTLQNEAVIVVFVI